MTWGSKPFLTLQSKSSDASVTGELGPRISLGCRQPSQTSAIRRSVLDFDGPFPPRGNAKRTIERQPQVYHIASLAARDHRAMGMKPFQSTEGSSAYSWGWCHKRALTTRTEYAYQKHRWHEESTRAVKPTISKG